VLDVEQQLDERQRSSRLASIKGPQGTRRLGIFMNSRLTGSVSFGQRCAADRRSELGVSV